MTQQEIVQLIGVLELMVLQLQEKNKELETRIDELERLVYGGGED